MYMECNKKKLEDLSETDTVAAMDSIIHDVLSCFSCGTMYTTFGDVQCIILHVR